MNKNILCLDFDDCILPSPVIYNGWVSKELALEELELNLKKIKYFLEDNNLDLFITSSWSKLFILKDNKIFLSDKANYYLQEDLYVLKAFQLMKHYLDNFVIGLSCGNRSLDILSLSENKNIKIVVFDDYDLSNLDCINIKFFRVLGSLTNNILYKAHLFLKS